MDENLVSKIKFVKAGKFVKKRGETTLRLTGDVQPVSGAVLPIKKVPSGIHRGDIFKAFFDGECNYPLEYLNSPLRSTTHNPEF